MKVNKIFSIDLILIELLKKEKNQSQIVNGLLKEYFKEELKNVKTNIH